MISFFLVLLFIGLVINISSHVVNINSIEDNLERIEESEGNRPEQFFDDDDGMPFSPGISEAFSPVFRRNHYFYINYDGQSGIVKTSSNSINSSESDIVEKYTRAILESDETFGHYGVYYFKRTDLGNGSYTLTLLDCTNEIASSLRLLLATIATTLIALVIGYILIHIFSYKLIQPEIENARRQKQFITNASHELKTPLAVIRANTELLEMTGGENEWTRSTLNQVDHLNGMIQNLVLISKAEEKEDVNNMVSLNATDIVEQTVSPYAALAKQSGKELVLELEKDVTVLADESKLRQLTTILTDNALKYCDDNGTVRVQLTQLKRNKNKIRLIVSNSYKDGEKVDCNRFFDRFYREDESHNIDKGGYGIGLSIAESICNRYRGSIKAVWKDGVISFICMI